MIAEMPKVLQWEQGSETFARVHASYVELLLDKLGELIGLVQSQHTETADAIVDLLTRVSDTSLQRALCAPETSFRLLWPRRRDPTTRAHFIMDALRAELRREGKAESFIGWTALGDMEFRAGGVVIGPGGIEGLMPIDFDSPFATALDFEGNAEVTAVSREPLDSSERESVLRRIRDACDGIRRTDSHLLDFCVRFTKVLILQRDPELPEQFTSGSSGQYIGRSVLANPHLPSVSKIEVAEAIVHEAIHSLLYMQEQRAAWVANDDLYGSQKRIYSPWTGNHLPLRPFMQAAFVWYGLLHFWANALLLEAFPRDPVQKRMAQATSGFIGPPLTSSVQPWEDGIAPELLHAINEMQHIVRASFGSVAA